MTGSPVQQEPPIALDPSRTPSSSAHRAGSGRGVLGVALLLVAAQLGFRAWALFPSWFYLDDYSLLLEAERESAPGPGYLLEPWNGHLMPAGRLVAWCVAHSGTLSWNLAVTLTLALQLVCSVAAVWMLVTLFGRRWAVLAPLCLYLWSAMTVPALMWWTASLTQLAMQAGFFVAVGAWVRYLRGDGGRWCVLAYAGVAFGLLYDVKAVLVLPLLAYLTVAYFATGGPVQRVREAVRRYWRGALVGLVPALAYAAYYSATVTQPFELPGASLAGELAQTMIGTAFLSATFGGPWEWSTLAPPNSFAAPPQWAQQLTWVVAALVLAYGWLRRQRTGRAWLLLAGYLAALLVLLLTSRAPVFGDLIGLEYRYLTDAACVLALCVGLAFLELRGAVGSSEPREEALLSLTVPPAAVAGAVVLVSVSGAVSSVGAVGHWHRDNVSDAYLHTLRADLRAHGPVDLVDTAVPDGVYSAVYAPNNLLSRFTPLLTDDVSYPEASGRLGVVGPDGLLRTAAIQPGTQTVEGPLRDCGWSVNRVGRTIPLQGDAFAWTWWLRIGYYASESSPLVVSAGDSEVTTELRSGLGSLYVRVEGAFDGVRIDGLSDTVRACVDTIEVGQPVPGGLLP